MKQILAGKEKQESSVPQIQGTFNNWKSTKMIDLFDFVI